MTRPDAKVWSKLDGFYKVKPESELELDEPLSSWENIREKIEKLAEEESEGDNTLYGDGIRDFAEKLKEEFKQKNAEVEE